MKISCDGRLVKRRMKRTNQEILDGEDDAGRKELDAALAKETCNSESTKRIKTNSLIPLNSEVALNIVVNGKYQGMLYILKYFAFS